MGLDISAYSGITKIDAVYEDCEAIDPITRQPIGGKWVNFYVNPHFNRHDAVSGVYRFVDSFRFPAGSYSGYGLWRDQLAFVAGWPPASRGRGYAHPHAQTAFVATGGPFWELIYFSDCEGTIGPATSAKLARDFAGYQAKADAFEGEDRQDTSWFQAKYGEWRRAFELAAQNGAVSFH